MTDNAKRDADALADRMVIRELIENWAVWRDAGDWARFATVWHDDGRMVATWFNAGAAEFIERCKRSFEDGLIVLHTLGGASVDVRGDRAVAHTKMQIIQRGAVHDVAVDMICHGRFIDALEKRDGRWGIVLRHPVYELDHVIPHQPGAQIPFDQAMLDAFPVGYRHLAYLQTLSGLTVNPALPGTRGPEIDALNRRMRRWLEGEPAACLDPGAEPF